MIPSNHPDSSIMNPEEGYRQISSGFSGVLHCRMSRTDCCLDMPSDMPLNLTAHSCENE